MADFSGGRGSSLQPQMKNDAVCLGGRRGDFLGLIFRHIQYLHTAGCDLYFMVMIKLTPGIEREFSCNRLDDKIFDVCQNGVGICRLKQQTSRDLQRDTLKSGDDFPGKTKNFHTQHRSGDTRLVQARQFLHGLPRQDLHQRTGPVNYLAMSTLYSKHQECINSK